MKSCSFLVDAEDHSSCKRKLWDLQEIRESPSLPSGRKRTSKALSFPLTQGKKSRKDFWKRKTDDIFIYFK